MKNIKLSIYFNKNFFFVKRLLSEINHHRES